MLYIIRHGQTTWNKELRLQGQTDIPLNEEGRRMAREASVQYKDILDSIDICFSSPLIRAYETAELLLSNRELSHNIITDDRLKEISFGEFEGLINQVSIPESPVYNLFHKPENYEAVGEAEGLNELLKRTGEFYHEVLVPLLNKGKNVLVVGHGGMNSALISNVLNWEKKDFWKAMTGNCKLLKITEDGVKSADGEKIKFIDWNKP